MRIFVAAVFGLVGVLLLASALGTLAAAPAIDQQTFAMMQVIAGLLCVLIAVVAGLARPSVPATARPPRPAAPQAAAAPPPAARHKAGLGLLIVGLAAVLIVLATWLRKPGHERDARALIPMPGSGSAPGFAPGPARPTAPAVLPTGGADSRRSGAKAHASRARPARDDD
jgi:hypothetical protein